MNASPITKITSCLEFLGKNLHLVGCATVCGKSEVMLMLSRCNAKYNTVGNECKDGGAPLNVREEKHKLFLGPGPTFTLDRLKRSLMAC